MNGETKRNAAWQAVARACDVRKKPIRIWFENQPVVLFRTGQGISAVHDRCPHRFAELSRGKVVGDTIECPYHGWRFGGDGQCVAIPGQMGPVPKIRARSYAAMEREDVVFISSGDAAGEPHTYGMAGDGLIYRTVASHTHSTLADTAENILDSTHTHFIHKGILRGLSAKRFEVEVHVTGGDDWVEAVYTGEDKQQGLVSALLEGRRAKTIGRFRHPGIVELEYWGPQGINIVTAFHLRQSTPERVDGVGWIAGPRQGGFGHIKGFFFRPMFHIALNQDRRILKSSLANSQVAPVAKPVIGPLDFLRTDIERIIAGKRPLAADEPRRHQIEL